MLNHSPNVIGIIPARYASTRFPGKPLALLQEKPMIQWVYESCSEIFDELYVATDDERISHAVKSFNGKYILTSKEHQSGTDRCLEALEKIEEKKKISFDIVVNIQGDEPLIQAEQLRELISCFDIRDTQIATLIKECDPMDDLGNPNMVKAVVDKSFKALYFSRSVIPFNRNQDSEISYYKHIGLYAYKTSALRKICQLPTSSLEKAESLEQLRWLENGINIQTRITNHESLGVDTPEDLARVLNELGK